MNIVAAFITRPSVSVCLEPTAFWSSALSACKLVFVFQQVYLLQVTCRVRLITQYINVLHTCRSCACCMGMRTFQPSAVLGSRSVLDAECVLACLRLWPYFTMHLLDRQQVYDQNNICKMNNTPGSSTMCWSSLESARQKLSSADLHATQLLYSLRLFLLRYIEPLGAMLINDRRVHIVGETEQWCSDCCELLLLRDS